MVHTIDNNVGMPNQRCCQLRWPFIDASHGTSTDPLLFGKQRDAIYKTKNNYPIAEFAMNQE